MKRKIVLLAILICIIGLTATTGIHRHRIVSSLWAASLPLNEKKFCDIDTLVFEECFFAADHRSYHNARLHFYPNEKQFSISADGSSSIHGKYEFVKKKNEVIFSFYRPDLTKPGTDDINEDWIADGKNTYSIRLITSDSLILIRNKD